MLDRLRCFCTSFFNRRKSEHMKKKLFKSGNAWVLLMQKAILELLDINPEIDEVDKDNRYERTDNKREYNLKEDGEIPRAVHPSRFIEVLRYASKHCMEYKVVHTQEVCLH